MIILQILKLVDFTMTQKSKYLGNETLIFVQIKNKEFLYDRGDNDEDDELFLWYG